MPLPRPPKDRAAVQGSQHDRAIPSRPQPLSIQDNCDQDREQTPAKISESRTSQGARELQRHRRSKSGSDRVALQFVGCRKGLTPVANEGP